MRILVCVSEYPPYASGIGDVAQRMVRQFVERGHSCTICSPTGPDIRLGNYGMIKRFGGLGVLLFWLSVSRYFRGKGSQWDAIWLHGPLFIRACPFPEAVITFHTTYKGYRTMARELRSSLLLKAYYGFMGLAERYCLRRINSGRHRFTAVSRLVASELDAQGIHGSDISYVSVGADVDRFCPVADRAPLRTELDIPEEALVLLYVGRLTHQKNLFSLVDAFAQLKGRLGQAMLLVAGSGELSRLLDDRVRRKKVNDVRLLGFVPNEELRMFCACADFFVMSSKYEGQPVALLEAMAAGLPPIVSDIPVMKQLVEESGAGIVVDFDDPFQAAERIGDYVLSAQAKQDRSTIREYVENHMSSAMCAQRYLGLLGQVTGKR
jgi:1,2-diacylglycerol 3-alpha-glucosyltransferase